MWMAVHSTGALSHPDVQCISVAHTYLPTFLLLLQRRHSCQGSVDPRHNASFEPAPPHQRADPSPSSFDFSLPSVSEDASKVQGLGWAPAGGCGSRDKSSAGGECSPNGVWLPDGGRGGAGAGVDASSESTESLARFLVPEPMDKFKQSWMQVWGANGLGANGVGCQWCGYQWCGYLGCGVPWCGLVCSHTYCACQVTSDPAVTLTLGPA